MKTRSLWWFAASVLLPLAVGCTSEEAAPPPPPPVIAADVVRADVPVYSEWVGQTRGSVNTEIRARVQGYLDAVEFNEGTFVRKGQLLYRINPLEYEAYVNRARGELAQAEANLARATNDVVRYKPLVAENAISREEYETSVSLQKASEAAVRAARAAVEKAQLDLSYCTVRAPIDGLAGKTEVQIGNLVGRGDNTLLTTISRIDPIRVRFSLSERELLEFRRQSTRSEARSIDLQLVLADGSTYEHPGRLVLADNRVDPSTGTLLLEAEFPNPDKLLQPGQFGRIRAVTDLRRSAVIIPQRAVTELQGQARIVVMDHNHVVTFRNVALGPRVGSGYVVDAGLEEGEMVVIEGRQRLRDSVVVKPTMTQIDPDSLVNRN